MALNLPSGEILEQAIVASAFNARQRLPQLSEQAFTGYLVVTLEGTAGLEEGALFFTQGDVAAAAYDYETVNLALAGDEALKAALNALAAPFAVLDLVQLSPQEIRLLVTLHPELKTKLFLSPANLKQFLPETFSTGFAEKHVKGARSPVKSDSSRRSLLKRLGLHSLG